MITNAYKLALAIAVVGPLTVAAPALASAGSLKEATPAAGTHLRARHQVVRQYWNYAPDRFNGDSWMVLRRDGRHPFAGSIWDNKAPY
jgi:hypothetical protein